MTPERTKILEMVAEGQLSIEDADRLLEAIAGGEVWAGMPAMPPIPPLPPMPPVPPVPPMPPMSRGLRTGRSKLDRLVELKIHGATPEWIAEMRQALGDDVAIDDLVQMRIHDITPEYVAEMRDAAGDELEMDRLVQMKIHGVTPEDVRAFLVDDE